jgi:alpha-D-ribose 1-methylphosphonate 5-triphosphate synthase subunit PhnG
MSRSRRTRILVDGNPALGTALCTHIERVHPVRVVSEPREVLVMNQVRDGAKGALFYLGEALLTECRVALGEVIGIGLLLGSQRRRAFELAVIDAAFSQPTPLPEREQWVSLLEQEEKRLAGQTEQQQKRLDATRVDFATMAVEGSDV